MREIVFELAETRGRPVFIQLCHAIIEAIEGGRLRPGQRLPGTRTLAAALKLHRNTVDAAYHEAAMQGWLVTMAARGTFVASDLPIGGRVFDAIPSSHGAEPALASSVPMARNVLRFSDGAPDARLLPIAELGRALRRALRRPDFLKAGGYGHPYGVPALREALAAHLASERGIPASADDLIVTRGSQMALFLAAKALLSPGDLIAVEDPGYPLAVAAFRAAGAIAVPIPVDLEGISITHLDLAFRRSPKPRAIYVTPHHQYPTTVTMSAARRIGLIEFARRHKVALIEDDYDHEYRFDGKPVLPLAARAGGDVELVYVGSLSKVLAPGIRLGYATGREDLIKRMAEIRMAIDRQGDVPMEQAVATLIADGDLGRHVRKTRRIYRARRDLLVSLLREGLEDGVSMTVPAGGLALWVRLGSGLDAEVLSGFALRRDLVVVSGARLSQKDENPPQALRLGFANLDETEIARGVEILASAAQSARRVQ